MSGNHRAASSAAARLVQCHPENRDNYPSLCWPLVKWGEFAECLAASEAGLAAPDGDRSVKHSHTLELMFFRARALFELGRYREAVDQLKQIEVPGFGIGRGDDPRLTRSGLMKASKAALRRK